MPLKYEKKDTAKGQLKDKKQDFGEYAFYDCTSLKKSITNYKTIIK